MILLFLKEKGKGSVESDAHIGPPLYAQNLMKETEKGIQKFKYVNIYELIMLLSNKKLSNWFSYVIFIGAEGTYKILTSRQVHLLATPMLVPVSSNFLVFCTPIFKP